MEKVNLWCRLVSSVSVVSSAFLLLIPESKLKKTFNAFIALILIFSVLIPLNSKLNINASTIFSESVESKINIENEIESYKDISLVICVQNEMKKYIESIISNMNISAECNVICEYIDNKIIIKTIEITGDLNLNIMQSLYNEIIKICTDGTKVLFNGDEYG